MRPAMAVALMSTFVRSNGTVIVVRDGGCYKVAFKHRRDAVKQARKVSGAMYVYECLNCSEWHLTSKQSRSKPTRAF